jgi:hypothetical protein
LLRLWRSPVNRLNFVSFLLALSFGWDTVLGSQSKTNKANTMKAIVTKYLPPTNSRGARIKATAEGLPSLTIPYPYELSGEACHRAAAEQLTSKYWSNASLVSGSMPDNTGYAFVMI